jgi:hypothetical protein
MMKVITCADPHNFLRIFKTVTMKLTIAALLIGYAAALAAKAKPTKAVKGKPAKAAVVSSLNFENELGVIAPTGFFDPFKLSKGISEEKFSSFRTAEIKHGRVAQLAVLGYVVPEFFRFGFDISPGLACADVPNGVAAIGAIPALGWAQIIFLVGVVDFKGFLGDFAIGKPDLEESELENRQLQELQHGRLAMLGFLELVRHDTQNGADGMDNLITGFPFLY